MIPTVLEMPSGPNIIRRTLYGSVSDERFIREMADLVWRAEQLSGQSYRSIGQHRREPEDRT